MRKNDSPEEIIALAEKMIGMLQGKTFATCMTTVECVIGRLIGSYFHDEVALLVALAKHCDAVEALARKEQQMEAGGLN